MDPTVPLASLDPRAFSTALVPDGCGPAPPKNVQFREKVVCVKRSCAA